ncbi:MAG: hypothetical protein ACRDF4_06475 [Rhabdochlamydiaceae bacterium]
MAAWNSKEHLINAALWAFVGPMGIRFVDEYVPGVGNQKMLTLAILALAYSYLSDKIGEKVDLSML